MKSLTVGVFLLLFLTVGYGQDQGPRLKIAYNGGMIVNPGLSLGFGYNLFGSADDSKRNQHELRLGLTGSFYYHRRLNTGWSFGPELEWVRTGRRGFQYGVSVHSGYLRTSITNTFSVDDSGGVSKSGTAGTNHFFYDVGLRLGRRLRSGNPLQMEWYVKPKLQFQTPYFWKKNQYFLTEIGVNFKI